MDGFPWIPWLRTWDLGLMDPWDSWAFGPMGLGILGPLGLLDPWDPWTPPCIVSETVRNMASALWLAVRTRANQYRLLAIPLVLFIHARIQRANFLPWPVNTGCWQPSRQCWPSYLATSASPAWPADDGPGLNSIHDGPSLVRSWMAPA